MKRCMCVAAARTLYNGERREQKLLEAEYRARFEKDAAQYARMLKVRLDAHAAQPTAQP